ncbi:helix-turn-helix domain-containing protein [Streptomyces sp. NPDC048417]|uniref:ATP-binding protein n=1 Tax=Streptomyces sp. NPDC048417 TaxID=3155387 RepID=UPI00343EC10E
MAGRPGRREQPLDPQAGPLERFALGLRELRESAGLTYLEMAQGAHFAASTLSQAAAGQRLPTREVLLAYVRACGGDPGRWADYWERVRREVYGLSGTERRSLTAVTPSATGRTEATSFVGREHELAAGADLLTRCRLVTLVGIGGVGKTRLAQRISRSVRERFMDGTYCAELADLGRDRASAEAVAEVIAAVVSVSAGPGQDPAHALATALRGRSVLLLLDNCEHVLDASAHVVRVLLDLVPELRILATSRQPLDIDAEHVLKVSPLALPALWPEPLHDTGATEQDPLASPAMTLFADRAGAASPGFRVTEANRHVVARVCRKLDGLPLALEIAARRLRTLTPDELLERLDHRFRLLGPGGRDRTAHPRHQALRALFDWSYELCTEAEQTAWQQLSLCVGGVLLADAERLCGPAEGSEAPAAATPDDTFEALAGLVDKSLLTTVDTGDHTRLHMLETVRAYGQERLAESDRTQSALRRHRTWYLGLAAQAGAAYGTSEEAGWLRRLRPEHPNLRQIVIAPPPGDEPAEIVLGACLGFWLHCLTSGNVGEGAHWMRKVIEQQPRPPASEATGTWYRAVWVAGFLLLLNGDHVGAQEMIGRGEHALADPADRTVRQPVRAELAAAFLQLRGLAALVTQDTVNAARYSQSSLETGHGVATLLTRKQCVAQLGFSAVIQGDHARATALLERALAMSDAQGDTWHRCYLLWALAVSRTESGRPQEAVELLRQALGHIREIDERLGEATISETLAWVLAPLGAAGPAAVVLGAVDRVWQPSGSPRLFGFALLTAHRERGIELARRSLGDVAYAHAYEKGRRLGLRRALDEAFRGLEAGES